jgi:hypothetical protein
LQQYFSYIMATSFSGGRSRSTRRESPTMGKLLVSPRFLCRPTTFCSTYWSRGTSELLLLVYSYPSTGWSLALSIRKTADLPLPLCVGTFRGYRILFSIRNPYIKFIIITSIIEFSTTGTATADWLSDWEHLFCRSVNHLNYPVSIFIYKVSITYVFIQVLVEFYKDPPRFNSVI